MNNKISVILTNYNKRRFLSKCIQSVLRQDYKNFELIIIDDHSTDNSQKIIKNFSKKDKRIKTIFRKKNSGTASIPRNEGIKISKGEYICFIDADDLWNFNKLSEQLKKINNKIILNFTACEYIDEIGLNQSNVIIDKIRLFSQKYFVSKGLAGLFAYNPIILSSVMIKKNILKKYYFDCSKSIIGVEDLDLWLKLFNDFPLSISFCENKLTKVRKAKKSLNREYTQASLRNTYCVIKFFLEKKIYSKVHFFLLGLILRMTKSFIKISQKVIKKYLIGFAIVFSLLYILIFHSPLFWYLGKKLVHYDKKEFTKYLVIMSGNGDDEYINTGYQRRYLDTKSILDKYKFDKIYIMGRLQEIEESKIIKSLFVLDGLKKDDIILINQKFRNTKENINTIEQILLENDIKIVNFLTSPYHSKRSKLLWKKQAKDIKVILTENIYNPVKNIRYNYNLKEIKIIVYESLALLYNKIRGWL